MSAHSNLDRDAFQNFLANAYATQTSGLDTGSFSALVEMQRFIMGDEFDLDRAMLMIAAHAVRVSNASGVAIALLEGNELVYRAGSGSAANDVGRHVPAVLSVCASDARKEILKVENAEMDSRVEAEVCRQFGVNSILMLPIYKQQVLVGVLQVQFTDAHAFLDRELRAYRLMLNLLEDAILREQNQQQAGASSTVEQIAHDSVHSQESQSTQAATPSVVAVGQTLWAGDNLRRRGQKLHARMAILSVMQRIDQGIWKQIDRVAKAQFWQVATSVAVSVMLVIATWTVYRNHSAATTNVPTFSTDRVSRQELPGKLLSAGMKEEQLGNGAKLTTARASAFKRVRIRPDEVDYIAEDVTIRTFSTKRRIHDLENEVRIGDDVTVRYFAPAAVPASSRQHLQ
jgi:GAF domain